LHQFTGTETILLVEDALAVRALTARVLRGLGYTVLEAANGQEALGIVEKHSGPPIALLLTDVVMPHMGGLSLADQLAPRFPAMKIMLMSGYADLAFAAHGALDSTLKLLSKPFTPDALARVVRGTLDSQPTGAR
jgi:CheY-like chemotaxis protein